jgi:hypothetical protein
LEDWVKDCKYTRRKLSVFIDNELTIEEELMVKQHLGKCAKCMRELEEMKGVWNLIGKIDDIEPSPYFWDVLHTKLLSQRKSLLSKLGGVVQSARNIVEDLFGIPMKPATIHTFSLDVFNDFPPESFGQLICSISPDKVK